MLLTLILSVIFGFAKDSAKQNSFIADQNFVISNWNMSNGLPQSSVNDIIQAKDGFIWLATFGGLVRFDGVSFETYNRSNTKGMRSDRLIELYEDVNNNFWISAENSFFRFKNGECKEFEFNIDGVSYSPSLITEDKRNRLWVTLNGESYYLKDSTFIAAKIFTDSQSIKNALKDTSGIWLNHKLQIYKTYGDSIVQILDLSTYLKENIGDVIEYPKNSGILFIGTLREGVLRYKDNKLEKYGVKDGLPSRYTWEFYLDKLNKLWVLSFSGLSHWDGTKFEQFQEIPLNNDLQFSTMIQDKQGNYWIGTPSNGLYRLRPSIISTLGPKQGLWNDKMLSLTELKNGTFLFATNCGGIYEWNGVKAVHSTINEFLPNLCVWSVFQDSKNRIWIGSRGLYMTTDLTKPGIHFDKQNSFFGTDVFTISEDNKGQIWIGCYNGIYVYDGKQFKHYSTKNGLSYHDTRVIKQTKDGKIWIGTSKGLNIMEDEKITQFELHSNLDSSKTMPYVRDIMEDENGAIWITTYGDGIYRIKDGNYVQITTKNGLFDNIVSHIVDDDKGYFWMGTNRGIFRVNKVQLNYFCDGKVNEINSYSYGVSDGMISAETNGGFYPNLIKDNKGKLYFPTINGVAVVNTNNRIKSVNPPKALIQKLKSGTVEFPLNQTITLPYDNAYIEIEYTALNYTEPNKIHFKYQMLGLTNTWFDVGDRRSALYTKIPPGNYTFNVTASNSDGNWNSNYASFKIIVIPPFWETVWFYTVTGAFFVLLITAVFYFRMMKLMKENEQQRNFTERLFESQEQERRRIAAELHDGLGQQIMIIKNRAELAQMEDSIPEETQNQLTEILLSAKTSISDVRNISHGLRPVHLEKFGLTEALNYLCDQIQQTSPIEWSYYVQNIDELLPSKQEIQFYRVIQEGTNNIQKHSKASEASVMISKTEKEIKATIWDDGIGFNQTKLEMKGLGLLGMTERLDAIGGSLIIESKPNEGTSLKITIPV